MQSTKKKPVARKRPIVSITLSKDVLDIVDKFAKESSLSRSIIIESAIMSQGALPGMVRLIQRRFLGWQNLMVFAINAGIEAGMFSVDPTECVYPLDGNGTQRLLRFSIYGMDALAAFGNLRGLTGDNQLMVCVAVEPTPRAETMLGDGEPSESWGVAGAVGFLERDKGRYLQAVKEQAPLLYYRPDMLPWLVGLKAQPNGYSPEGPFDYSIVDSQ